MAPSLTVVIPARDGSRFVEDALASVFAQTRAPERIIVVDDGSTDGTAERVAGIGGPVRLIRTPPRGVAAARNTGVEAATTDFVAFLDADDYWDADHLATMTEAIEATSGRAGLYFSDIRLAEERGGKTLWRHCGFDIDGAHELCVSDKRWLFLSWQPILLQASVVSRKAYLAVGGSDDRLTRRSDTHLIFKLGASAPLCAVAGVAGEWTARNETSLTRVFADDHDVYRTCTVALYTDLADRLRDLGRGQRRELRRRSAEARVSLAAQAARRDPRAAAAQLGHAALQSPLTPLRRAWRKTCRPLRVTGATRTVGRRSHESRSSGVGGTARLD